MKLERRGPLLWLISGAVLICAWCSLLSGVGGWLMGQDLARREEQANMAATIASQPDLPTLGVLVIRLDRTGPAALAGLHRGDMIIAINDTQVEGARDLHEELLHYRVGDIVRLTVEGEQGQEVVNVRTVPFPGDDKQPYLGIYYTARGDEPADL